MRTDILRESLRRSGLTNGQVARICGLNKQTITNVLSGQNSPTVRTLELLCGAIGLDITELFKYNKQ